MMQLLIDNVTKKFGDHTVLEHINYDFEQGRLYSVLGKNGAGKTTLFRCINEELLTDEGYFFILQNNEKRALKYGDVGMVSASPILPEFLTGYEYIKFFMEMTGSENPKADIRHYFELISLEEKDWHRLIREYSFGMKNKLQLLCCFIRKPPIILLDEPLSSFDIVVSHEIKQLLMQMKQEHIIIMSTHIMQLAQDVSDEIVLLQDGHLTQLMEGDELKLEGFEDKVMQAFLQEERAQ